MVANYKLLRQNCSARSCDKQNNPETGKPTTQQDKKPVTSRIHLFVILGVN